MKSCCVTGHRDISDDKVSFITEKLRYEIIDAINDGFAIFISGFAPGVDMIFARLIVSLQREYPQIHLDAALPYPTWMNKRNLEDKELLSKCRDVKAHSPKYQPNCMFLLSRFLANSCERVIAVYDGREKGGTVKTMQYANALGRDIRRIDL